MMRGYYDRMLRPFWRGPLVLTFHKTGAEGFLTTQKRLKKDDLDRIRAAIDPSKLVDGQVVKIKR